MQDRVRILLAGAVLLALTGTAVASAAGAGRQAWVRSSPVPTFVAEEQHLYVAAAAGSEETRAFVEVPGLTDRRDETLVLVEDGGRLQDMAGIAACAFTGSLPSSGEISPREAPEPNCRFRIDVTRSQDGTWSVPLGLFATASRDARIDGVALLPALEQAADSWQVALDATATTLRAPPGGPDGDDGTGDSDAGPPSAPDEDTDRRDAAGEEPGPDAAPGREIDGGSAGERPREGAGTPGERATAGPVRPGLAPGRAPAAEVPAPSVAPPDRAEDDAPASGSDQTTATAAVHAPARNATSPHPVPVLAAIALLGSALLLPAGRRRRDEAREAPDADGPSESRRLTGRRLASTALAAGAVVAGSAVASQLTVFRLGLVLIVFVGAIGLHVLVNWTGELSLAHAGFVGVPAFVVARVSAESGWSPILLLPLGVAVGAALAAVVGLPALRAKGLQVALVTLAAGIAIDRFLFTKTWFVGGSGGVEVATPTLGPLTLSTSRSLFAVLLAAVVLACAVAWALYNSKVGRGLLRVRADSEVAAAAGVPAAAYKLLGYALAGAFAGLAGGLAAMWVQTLTPQAFPVTLSFTYLLIVVLAGRGFIGGVLAAAAMLEGGRVFIASAGAVFAYGGPIALIIVLTRYRAGLNGLGEKIMETVRPHLEQLRDRTGEVTEQVRTNAAPTLLRPGLVVGIVALALGGAAIALAWYHAGNTDQVWIQNQEILSGGFGGLALTLLGVGLLIRDGLVRAQERAAERILATLTARTEQLAEPAGEATDAASA